LQRGPSGCLPALKKLCAQEVSLFCVFKISAEMPGSVICGFPNWPGGRNLFFNAACRAVPRAECQGCDRAGSTAHQFTWHKADITRLSSNVRFWG